MTKEDALKIAHGMVDIAYAVHHGRPEAIDKAVVHMGEVLTDAVPSWPEDHSE